MSWLKLRSPIGTNYRVETEDLMNSKRTLSQLGYYDVPPHRGIDDWTDEPFFDGIRRFQKDKGLKVDALMRPGRPTERAINARLVETGTNPGLGEGETPPLGSGRGGIRQPGNNMPVVTPPNVDQNMPVFTESMGPWYPSATVDEHGNPRLEGPNPKKGFPPIRPPKGPY